MTFELTYATLTEARELITLLGGVRLPVRQESYVVEGFDDDGRATRSFYRHTGGSSFHVTEKVA